MEFAAQNVLQDSSGGKFSNFPQWYVNKLEGGAFLLRDRFQNVPHFCPEQLGVRNFK